METSNSSVCSDISIHGSSLSGTPSNGGSAPISLTWRQLTPKSSAGVRRIKATSLLMNSNSIYRMSKSIPVAKCSPSPRVMGIKSSINASHQQQAGLKTPTSISTSSRPPSYLLDETDPVVDKDETSAFLTHLESSSPKSPSSGREHEEVSGTQQRTRRDSDPSLFPSTCDLEYYDHTALAGLDESFVNDPPCSDSLMDAYETLHFGSKSSLLMKPICGGSSSMNRQRSMHASKLHESVAATKKHFVSKRVECKDSDGRVISYQSRLSITPHEQGIVICMPDNLDLLSQPKHGKDRKLWCLPSADRHYKPRLKSVEGKTRLVVSEHSYIRNNNWENSIREEPLSPWMSKR